MNLTDYTAQEIMPYVIFAFMGLVAVGIVVFMLVLARVKRNIIAQITAQYIPVTEMQQLSYNDAKRLAMQLIRARYPGSNVYHQYAREFNHHSAKYIGQVFSQKNQMESPHLVKSILDNLAPNAYSILDEAA